jgi:hypothetical protein
LDCDWHFTRFTAAKTHFSVAVTDNCQGSETENTATLNHFCHTVDLHQFFLQVALLLLLSLIVIRHIDTLEFQSTFTSGIGQGLDPSVVLITATIKSHLLDTGFPGTFCYQFANGRGGIGIAGLTATQAAVQRRCTGQNLVAGRCDYLGVYMARCTVHTQTNRSEVTHAGSGATGAS